ncbi:MAG: UvrD-helicase domain-containing protein [Planctomyces sp.]|nr:UvrD-helicase domain-containing protein [Planctomyces sp.]
MAEQLTEAQQRAVEHFYGPLMVLAGPGSGKTRVISHRITRLLQRGVHPGQILALTFTNKAAREMAARIERLNPGTRIYVSTFHRFCAGLLRQSPDAVGLKENFTIFDQHDQIQLVRRIIADVGFDPSTHEPSRVLQRMSRARNDLVSSEEFRRRYEERVGDPLDAVVYEVFPAYERLLLHQNAVDFDDLLLHVVKMLNEDDGIRSQLDDRYRFILVDEYQDTNLAQYRIVQGISQEFPNLCATGDPDQSIYGWRGARPENISAFERDFPDVKIVALDHNFRSTQSIVQCADQLISNNRRPHRGHLTTQNPEGNPVSMMLFDDAEQEANGIAEKIVELVESGERSFKDFAIFYRINALSRLLETAMSRHKIPYQVAAGFSFYERAEIRDLIAYLRLIENPSDDAAFLRIINTPARGIGARTLLRVGNFAEKHGLSMFAAACRVDEITTLPPRSRKPIHRFVDLIQRLQELASHGPAAPVLERLIADVDYLSLWHEDADGVDTDRAGNVHELISAARQYDAAAEDTDGEPPSVQGFLQRACLSSEVDNVNEEQGAVTLMTIHAAKGLEFPWVFIVGLENGLIPHERAVRNGDPSSFEEERRLLFVGITRAKQELTLTQTMERTFRGMRRTTISSPFIMEINSLLKRDVVEQPPMPAMTITALDERLQAARRRFEAVQDKPNRALLMTAADLEARQASKSGDGITIQFREGMLVRHPRYGRGTVTTVSGGVGRVTVTVVFEHEDRCETFVAGKCPLQPVGLS